MRADLRRFYGVSFDDVRRGRVPLADAAAFAADLPHVEGSATGRALNDGKPVWTTGDYLAADVWAALTGKRHPGWPKATVQARRPAAREAALDRARARAEDRRRRLAAAGHT